MTLIPLLSTRMKFRVNCFEPIGIDVRVNLRRRDVGMAQQFLDNTQIRAAADEVAGEAVAERVRRYAF